MIKNSVVIFDIDGALCFNTASKNSDCFRERHPECLQVPDKNYGDVYIFKPYIQNLIVYLLKMNVKIKFFSLGTSDRNENLVEELLIVILGKTRYETLKLMGQFEIFSRCHAKVSTRQVGFATYSSYTKDLNVIFENRKDLRNAILIDDNPNVIARSIKEQRDFISLVFLDSDDEKDDSESRNEKLFYKNGVYYLLGLFTTYFTESKYRHKPLRNAMRIMLQGDRNTGEDDDDSGTDESAMERAAPVLREMIAKGLRFVRQTRPEAILYGAQSEDGQIIFEPEEAADLAHSADDIAAITGSILSGERGACEPTIAVLMDAIEAESKYTVLSHSHRELLGVRTAVTGFLTPPPLVTRSVDISDGDNSDQHDDDGRGDGAQKAVKCRRRCSRHNSRMALLESWQQSTQCVL